MSIKSRVFQALLYGQGPAPTHSYVVLIPELSLEGFLVSSFQLPVLNRSSVQVDYQGERLELPAGFDTTGQWKFKVIENPSLSERYKILAATTQSFRSRSYTSVHIYIANNDLITPVFTLKNAWFKARSPVPFGFDQVTTPWVWDVTLVYNGIEEVINFIDLPPVRLAGNFLSGAIARGVVSPLTQGLSGLLK